MEILGSTFDDSVFEESRNKVSKTLPSFKAKFCEPQWFCETADSDDVLEMQKTYKFRADHAYRRKQYETAVEDYTACLSLIPDSNLSIKRDVLEGITRCLCHLGRRDQALMTIEKLRKEASNTCHLTCILQLELSIYEHYGEMGSCISALQHLCSIHPFNPWHWLKLATSYLSLLPAFPSSSSSVNRSPPHQQDSARHQMKTTGEQGDRVWLKACMCFIRTRLLIGILRIQQSSFVLESSKKALEEVDEALQSLQPTERTLQIISEVISEDLNPEKMREENQDGESLTGLCIRSFADRWWDKVSAALQKEDGPISTSERILDGS